MLTARPGAFQSQALVGVQAKWAKCFGEPGKERVEETCEG